MTCGIWVPVTVAWHVLRLQMEEWLPVWRLAVNILYKQSQKADKGWFSSLGIEWDAKIHKNCHVVKCFTNPQTWAGSMVYISNGKGPWDSVCGMWGAKELTRYWLDWMGLQEFRWDEGGTEWTENYNPSLWKRK